MLNSLRIALATAVVVASIGVAVSQSTAPALKWYKSLDQALAVAKKEHKIVMVDFNATWCGPCKLYKRDVFPKAAFQKAAKDLVLVDIDTDENQKLAQKYRIEGIPDIRFLGADGKELGKVVGFGGEKRLLDAIKSATSKAKS